MVVMNTIPAFSIVAGPISISILVMSKLKLLYSFFTRRFLPNTNILVNVAGNRYARSELI